MFKKAADLGSLDEDEITRVELDGEDIALYTVDGTVYATSNICPHAQCLLHENGVVYERAVECSCHGSTYDLVTGDNINPPASDPLPIFAVTVEDGQVLVDTSTVETRVQD